MKKQINPTNYVVTAHPSQQGTYWVWRDGLEEPYETTLQPSMCTCPHWIYRLRKHFGSCKHHVIVLTKLVTGGVL